MNANDPDDLTDNPVTMPDEITPDISLTSGSFDDLAKELEGKTNYTLTKNYTFSTNGSDDAYKNGIHINHPITINGAGFTISGSDLATIFKIEADNVVLNDITFVNAQRAIHVTTNGDNLIINKSNFYNNSLDSYAVAILWEGDNGVLMSSNFFDNSAKKGGGAISWVGNNGTILNSKFINNSDSDDSGAVKWRGNNGNISRSS